MKALKAFVDQENKWAAVFNGRQLDINDPADRQEIADRLDCALSPENLTCDGELSRSEVQRKYRRLHAAASALVKLDPSVTMYEFY